MTTSQRISSTERSKDKIDQLLSQIESLSDEELDVMHARYERIREECVERQQWDKSAR